MRLSLARDRDAWWAMGLAGIWLVFLVFPAVDLWRLPWAPRLTGYLLMAVFVVAYLASLRSIGPMVTRDERRGKVMWFGVQVAVVAATVPILGVHTLGYLPFLIAAVGYGFWMPLNMVLAVVVCAIGVVVAWLAPAGSGLWSVVFAGGINVLVAWLVTGVMARGQRAEESARQLLVAEERNRIASDVHDLLGHSLTVVNLKLQLIERLLDADPARARQELGEVRDIVTEALAGVRQTVSLERSTSLADEIAAAKASLATAGVEAEVTGDPEQVTGPIALVAGWVVREAVTNVLRHAHASRCSIAVGPHSLTIDDDGDGRTGRRDGNGIRGMRERVAAAGGAFEIGASPLGGTRASVSW